MKGASMHGSYPIHPQHDERSIARLFSDAMHHTAELVRKEIALAKAEVAEKIATLRSAAVVMAVAAVLLFAGLLVLLGAAVLIVDLWLHQPWLSALMVAVGTIGIGAAALLSAVGMLKRETVTPERTLRSLDHDKDLVAEHLS
jgi:uncharacterized membrane protein YqjE